MPEYKKAKPLPGYVALLSALRAELGAVYRDTWELDPVPDEHVTIVGFPSYYNGLHSVLAPSDLGLLYGSQRSSEAHVDGPLVPGINAHTDTDVAGQSHNLRSLPLLTVMSYCLADAAGTTASSSGEGLHIVDERGHERHIRRRNSLVIFCSALRHWVPNHRIGVAFKTKFCGSAVAPRP
jgi:hypothetical protein